MDLLSQKTIQFTLYADYVQRREAFENAKIRILLSKARQKQHFQIGSRAHHNQHKKYADYVQQREAFEKAMC